MPPTPEELQAQLAELQAKVTDLSASNAALNSKNRELLGEKKGMGEKLSFLTDKLGVKVDDPDAIDQAAALLEQARNPGAKPAAKDDKQVEKLRTQMQEEIAKREKEASSWRGRFENTLVEREIAEALAAEGGIPDLLLPMMRGQVRVVEEGGNFSAQVHDSDGSARLVAGKPMTARQLVQSLKADPKFGGAFLASGASGSGASSTSGQRPNTGEKTSFDKIKSGLATLK